MFKGAHRTLRNRFSRFFSPLDSRKETRRDRRIRLQLEELETRALLSANPATQAVAPNDWAAQTNATATPAAFGGVAGGYTPQQLQQAYGASSLLAGGTNGAGTTIAIVDAYNDPNIQNDLATFSSRYGLPTANLSVVNQTGGTSLPTTDSTGSWEMEESLDVEWAHAVAPGANIVLVEANSSNLNDLLAAVDTASGKNGSSIKANVVSLSWGGNEFQGETSYDSHFSTPGITYVASAGDNSAYAGPEWPASSPNVLAVGGTTLNLASSNTISSETAWNATYSSRNGYTGGGGGISSLEAEPSYQYNAGIRTSNGGRPTPDVSWDANPSTGVSVYDSYMEPGWGYVGGTSAGAPAWAGIVALADQKAGVSMSTATVDTTLYKAYSNSSTYSADFHDITSGSNGYSATKGYDVATGLGTPVVSNVVAALATAAPSASGSVALHTSTTTGGATGTVTTGQTHVRTAVEMAAPTADPSGSAATNSVIISAGNVPSAPTVLPPTTPTTAANGTAPAATLAWSPTTGQQQSAPVLADANSGPTGLTDSTAARDGILFGAGAWTSSWRLSSQGMSAPVVEQLLGQLTGGGDGQAAPDGTGDDAVALDVPTPVVDDMGDEGGE